MNLLKLGWQWLNSHPRDTEEDWFFFQGQPPQTPRWKILLEHVMCAAVLGGLGLLFYGSYCVTNWIIL